MHRVLFQYKTWGHGSPCSLVGWVFRQLGNGWLSAWACRPWTVTLTWCVAHQVQQAWGGLGLAPVSRRKPRKPLSTWSASGSDLGRPRPGSRALLVDDLARRLRAIKTGVMDDLAESWCSVMHKPLTACGHPKGKGGTCTHGPGLGVRRVWLVLSGWEGV